MIIVAIAWIYVVLMMALTETSFVAGIMTFLIYCVLPLSVILYLLNTPNRRRRQRIAEQAAAQAKRKELDAKHDMPSEE